MKGIKWRILILTAIVCLLPILLGVALWEQLPETMAIHFDMHNQPDNFASKGFVVFGLPCLMTFFQIVSCLAVDFNSKVRGEQKKIEQVSKWILPAVMVVLYITTLGYGMGWNIDIRMVAAVLTGGMFLVIGNYLPKLDYIKHYNLDTDKARKINRFVGFETVILGILFLGSIFFPPVATVVCVFLMIPCIVIGVIYGVAIGKSKED